MTAISQNLTLEAFSARLGRTREPGTRARYVAGVRRFVAWLDGRDPADVRTADVEAFLDDWVSTEAPAAATQCVTLSAVRSYFEFLRSKGLFEGENPVDRAEKPKRSRKANDWLREDEDRALLDTTGNARERIVIQLLRWSGLRVSEACGLLVSDVDMERDEIRVRESKTTSGVRTVPLLPELKLALSQWLLELRVRDLYSANAPLLCTSSGGHMSAGYAWRIVKRVAKRAGIRSISPHTLRRTFGSHLLNKGVRMDTVSKLLGHAHPGVTAACYAELLDQTVRDEVLRALA